MMNSGWSKPTRLKITSAPCAGGISFQATALAIEPSAGARIQIRNDDRFSATRGILATTSAFFSRQSTGLPLYQ